MKDENCPYCNGTAAGAVIWSDERCRVLLIEDSPFVGLCRVAWNAHVAELSDLSAEERAHLMTVVSAVETAIRRVTNPVKMNLGALGTLLPHLHWHVIPRQKDDTHFPEPIWASAQREDSGRRSSPEMRSALAAHILEQLG